MLIPNVNLDNKTIFVTGAVGFIGMNLVTELLDSVHGAHIVGLDNMNDYYDVSLKEYRLERIEATVLDLVDHVAHDLGEEACPIFVGVLNGAFLFMSDFVRHYPMLL